MVDTLATLRSQMPEAVVFSLVGADSFLSLPQWREPRRLLALAEWIVVSRPGSPLGNLASLGLMEEERKRIHLIESVHDEVSATELRHRLADGDPCRDLIAPAVADYIRGHDLYRRPTPNDSTRPL
jgi:nicotinate-nucleotide adenylyltransferase